MKKIFVSLAMILLLALPVVSFGASQVTGLARGIEAYATRDYTTARKILTPLAEAGEAKAQYTLGRMYLNGLGVMESRVEAVSWINGISRHKATAQIGAARYRGQVHIRLNVLIDKIKAFWCQR